jgi:hypothetical protein
VEANRRQAEEARQRLAEAEERVQDEVRRQTARTIDASSAPAESAEPPQGPAA